MQTMSGGCAKAPAPPSSVSGHVLFQPTFRAHLPSSFLPFRVNQQYQHLAPPSDRRDLTATSLICPASRLPLPCHMHACILGTRYKHRCLGYTSYRPSVHGLCALGLIAAFIMVITVSSQAYLFAFSHEIITK